MALVSTSDAVDSDSITEPGGATNSMRCAIPTCRPVAPYPSHPEPISPAITRPEFRPTRTLRFTRSWAATSMANGPAASWMARPARHARRAWSSNAIGAPKMAITPSPVDSTVPPKRRTATAERSNKSVMSSR